MRLDVFAFFRGIVAAAPTHHGILVARGAPDRIEERPEAVLGRELDLEHGAPLLEQRQLSRRETGNRAPGGRERDQECLRRREVGGRRSSGGRRVIARGDGADQRQNSSCGATVRGHKSSRARVTVRQRIAVTNRAGNGP